MQKGMSEYHVDTQVSNLIGMDVQVRVGRSDMSTHPWFSRRMHRLLQKNSINCTLEEVPGKAHWWWDTAKENDGGALNNAVLLPALRE